MDMNNTEILAELDRLEMRAGCHVLPEPLRQSIIAALGKKKAPKRTAGGLRIDESEPPTVKGKTPE